jgi:ribonuclease HI
MVPSRSRLPMSNTLFPLDPLPQPVRRAPKPAAVAAVIPAEVPAGDPAAADWLMVATDGSCLGNPGAGGWGAAVLIGRRWADPERWMAGGLATTTNNAMELFAIATVLHELGAHPGTLEIVTDSRYAIDALTKWVHGWRTNGWRTGKGGEVKNLEIIQLADAQLRARNAAKLPTRFTWVKGHAGHEGNEFVDDRARQAAERMRAGGNVSCGPGLAARPAG